VCHVAFHAHFSHCHSRKPHLLRGEAAQSNKAIVIVAITKIDRNQEINYRTKVYRDENDGQANVLARLSVHNVWCVSVAMRFLTVIAPIILVHLVIFGIFTTVYYNNKYSIQVR
jgi:hypothetical protein